MLSDSAYGPLDRLLHRLALGTPAIAEMAFDIDQALARPHTAAATAGGPPVFIAGLARAGTTILLRRLHAAGGFRSLTYRDMPFVLAPTLWRRLSGLSRRTIAAAERAHGDGILVDADSPESLDEVFWRVIDGDRYIRPDALLPHDPAPETIAAFRRYVAAIVAASDAPGLRYLSKNNNSILRLPALRRAFPQARLVVPIRSPLDHARSLHRQHQRFLAARATAPFIASYMTWLGHHEFGPDHRPFRVTETSAIPPGADPGALAYWLGLWIDVHDWLGRTAPPETLVVCHEDLCTDPAVWAALARHLGVDPAAGAAAAPFQQRTRPEDADITPTELPKALEARATALYDGLRVRAGEITARPH